MYIAFGQTFEPSSPRLLRERKMGKKFTEEEKEASSAFQSLFADSNPYRRKPQSVQDQSPGHDKPLGLGFEASAVTEEEKPDSNLEGTNKKRKRGRERNPNPDANGQDLSIGKKRNKRIVDDDGASSERTESDQNDVTKKKKKRKRDVIEEEYEARMFGTAAEKIDGGDVGPSRVAVGEKRKVLDDSTELIDTPDGYDDENKLQRTVFVGNLPLKVKKKFLLKEFRQFGEVESVRIRSVPIVDTKTPRKGAIIKGNFNDLAADSVHAYIVFKDEQSARAALSHNMAKIGEHHIRVDRACPPRKKLKGESGPLYDNKRTVFVGNLPYDVKDEELYQLFSGINQMDSCIEAIRVIRDPHSSAGKGIAYVLFKTRDAANQIVKKRHLKLRDRDLRLYHARSDSTPSKRVNVAAKVFGKSLGKRPAADSGQKLSDTIVPKLKKAAKLSYQGIRASKPSGVQNVNFHPRTEEHGKFGPKGKGNQLEPKARKSKRPAVAARKAKALKASGTVEKQLDKKRKLESRTPEDSNRKKKSRKFR